MLSGVRARDDNFRKDDGDNQGCFRKHVYNRNEQKECGQASHMGCQERVKAPLSIFGDEESIEVTNAKKTRKEEDHRREK
jgi:hypothetical protein